MAYAEHDTMTGVIVFRSHGKSAAFIIFFSFWIPFIWIFSSARLVHCAYLVLRASEKRHDWVRERASKHYKTLIQSWNCCHSLCHPHIFHSSIIVHSSHFTKMKTNIEQINKTYKSLKKMSLKGELANIFVP